MDQISILPILKKIPLFASLSEKTHEEIIKRITLEYYPDQYVLIKEGEIGGCLYIIKKGSVLVYKNVNEKEVKIAELKANDFFGEMALMSDKPRIASVKIFGDSELFKLEKDDFKTLLSTNQNMATIITEEFLNRIKENNKNKL